MIRIITHGTRKTAECERCGCLFSYEEEDVKTKKDPYDRERKVIFCPQCKNQIKINSIVPQNFGRRKEDHEEVDVQEPESEPVNVPEELNEEPNEEPSEELIRVESSNDITDAELERLYFKEGLTVQQIANKYEVNNSLLYKRVHKMKSEREQLSKECVRLK